MPTFGRLPSVATLFQMCASYARLMVGSRARCADACSGLGGRSFEYLSESARQQPVWGSTWPMSLPDPAREPPLEGDVVSASARKEDEEEGSREYGALFCTFAYQGDPLLALCYFKTTFGHVRDLFWMRTAPVNTTMSNK